MLSAFVLEPILYCKCMNACYIRVKGRNAINMRNTFPIQNISRLLQPELVTLETAEWRKCLVLERTRGNYEASVRDICWHPDSRMCEQIKKNYKTCKMRFQRNENERDCNYKAKQCKTADNMAKSRGKK